MFNINRDRTALLRWLRIMKLTTCLLLFTLFHVSASVYSQKKLLNLRLNNSSIKEVFYEIEHQSDFTFLYNDSKIDVDRKVSLDMKNKRVEEILDVLLEDTGFNYRIINNQIILLASSERTRYNGQQEKLSVSGIVTDDLGEPLPGVNVFEKSNPTNGVITGIDGSYTILVSSGEAVLTYSFIGYNQQDIRVAGRSSVDITLVEESIGLDEVVAVGYGVQRKEVLTGSITALKGKDLVKSQQPNLSNAFAGRMSGIIAMSPSGEPGVDGSKILIRGQSTIGDNSPLIVIDGVANRLGGLERIDPNDIESVSVLKDASAAIYGAQAANGVILITTKRGTKGKPVFSFTFNQGFAQPTRLPDMADAATYA